MKKAFVKSLPILFSYVFIAMAFSIMMKEAGFKWFHSLLASVTVYTGAFQFVLVSFLSSGASLVTVILTALLMNSRETFYSISFLNEFNEYKFPKRLYMMCTLTDETYAVNCSIDNDDPDRKDTMFYIALLSHIYWIVGTLLGSLAGQLIPFALEGIDFCMTALFVIIFIDQWEKAETHVPAVIGLVVGVTSLLIFGKSRFMLPALLASSGLLMIFNRRQKNGQ